MDPMSNRFSESKRHSCTPDVTHAGAAQLPRSFHNRVDLPKPADNIWETTSIRMQHHGHMGAKHTDENSEENHQICKTYKGLHLSRLPIDAQPDAVVFSIVRPGFERVRPLRQDRPAQFQEQNSVGHREPPKGTLESAVTDE